MMDDISDELIEICRTCLSKSEQLLPLTAVIDEENFMVKDYLKKYVQFECIENDNQIMPKNICLKCFDRLLEVRNYHIQCQESEKYLKLQVSLPHPKKFGNVKATFEIVHDKNDIDSFENLEILNENEILEFENNPEGIIVVESDCDDDPQIENLGNKFQDLNDFEYLSEKSENKSISSKELDFQFEDKNSIFVENLEDVDGNSAKLVGNNEHKSTVFKCVSCNTVFNSSTEFQNHGCLTHKLKELDDFAVTDNSLNNISSTCRHRCEFCESTFVLLAYLHRHMIFTHKKIISKKIELSKLSLGCMNCGKQYIPTKKRNRYKKKKQQFVCTICGKVYKNPQSFKEHEFAHKGIKPYKCEYCGREFGHECVRRSHIKLHLGKDIICEICNKTFAAQSQLRIHMTYHTNDLKFACDMCPKRFRRNHVLQLHKKVHTGKKTEQCEYCDSCFYTKDYLRGHINSVHLKRYHCSLCKNRYSEPGLLKKHMLKNHKIEIDDVSNFKKRVNELEILQRTRK